MYYESFEVIVSSKQVSTISTLHRHHQASSCRHPFLPRNCQSQGTKGKNAREQRRLEEQEGGPGQEEPPLVPYPVFARDAITTRTSISPVSVFRSCRPDPPLKLPRNEENSPVHHIVETHYNTVYPFRPSPTAVHLRHLGNTSIAGTFLVIRPPSGRAIGHWSAASCRLS